MTVKSGNAAGPKRSLGWLQFSLRTILVLTTIVAVLLGLFASRARRAQRQKAAVEAIQFLGGDVIYAHEDDGFGSGVARELPGPEWGRKLFGVDFYRHVKIVSLNDAGQPKDGLKPTTVEEVVDVQEMFRRFQEKNGSGKLSKDQLAQLNAILRRSPFRSVSDVPRLPLTDRDVASIVDDLAGLPQLRELTLWDNGSVSLEDCPELEVLTQLEELNLHASGLTDQGTSRLARLESLKELDVAWTKITDAGMPSLGGPSALETLHLSGNKISDRGVAHLKSLHQLRRLSLDHTNVSDAGIAHLASLTKLERLNLAHTQVTDAGAKKLSLLTGLSWLDLQGTQITAAALDHLKSLSNLQYLNVRQTAVTEPETLLLKEKLPGLRIDY